MTLTTYLLASALLWSPAKLHKDETTAVYESRLRDIAADVADVAEDEAPAVKGDRDRSRTATLVLAVAFFESGFQAYVDHGDCDDAAWRSSPAGHAIVIAHADCDRMTAFSMWQIHPDEGLVFTPEGGVTRAGNYSRAWLADNGERVMNGYDLITDRKTAVRVALRMIRRAGPTLEGYTGEKPTSGFPKAHARASFAEVWSRKHPFDVNAETLR